MDKDEVLKLALNALEAGECDMVETEDGHMVFIKDHALAAIKEVLTLPAIDFMLSNDDFHDDEFIEVFRVDFTDGKTCFFGRESVAKACARETGTVTAVHIPRREFYICAAKEVENEYC